VEDDCSETASADHRARTSYSEDVRRLALILIVVSGLPAVAAAGTGGRAPNRALQLRVSRWVAPSSFAATVTGQTAGLKVRRSLAVTLVLDRRTRYMSRDAAGVVSVVRCTGVRPTLAQRRVLNVNASGQFETGHLGAIGFRARSLTLLP
jgi:hypothetical protein